MMSNDLMDNGATVFVVDDDGPIRDSLSLILGLWGYRTASYASAETFLAAWQPGWTGCIVADLRLPGISGIEMQAELRERGSQLPFVVITAHGGVPAARASFLAEAVDFLEKPFNDADLKTAIEKGLTRERTRVQLAASHSDTNTRLARLTPREREVLELAGKGLHAKEVARVLGISPRTVEIHKASAMEKLGAKNIAELVRFALAAEDVKLAAA